MLYASSMIGRIAAYGVVALVILAAAAILVRFAIRSFRSLGNGCASCHGASGGSGGTPAGACRPTDCSHCPMSSGCAAERKGRNP